MFLKHLLAILLGVTVLPLRRLAYNASLALVALLAGAVLTIAIPTMLAKTFNESSMPKLANLLLTGMIIFPVVVLLSVGVSIVGAAYLIYDTVVNMSKAALLGFRKGWSDGMDGFWDALRLQREEITRQFTAYGSGVSENQLISDVDFAGFQRITGELVDVVVVREPLEVPNIESSAPQVLIVLLNEIELEQFRILIEQFASSPTPLSEKVRTQLDTLKILLTQYNDLSQKLAQVRLALESGDNSKIQDELIPYNDVVTPILFVKQYEKAKQWFNVPAASYVTDKKSILTWLQQNPRHPLNKDLLKTPEKYRKMETRYTWYELTAKDCSSQELTEAATQIRILASELTGQPTVSVSISSTAQTFFGGGADVPQHRSDDLVPTEPKYFP